MTGGSALLDPRDEHPAARARLCAWLELQHRTALHPQEGLAALEREGDPDRALRLLRPARGGSLSPGALREQVERLRRAGARGLHHGSSLYPPELAHLSDAAPLLWVRGDAAALVAPAVAIVGARAATQTGRHVARRLAGDLAELGLTVVSGLARGIDGEAHRGALERGGTTVAVLACGPDRVYPREHAALARAITERGAVLSELPPGTLPLARFFPLRNRLISGLARVVVVVEARLRSGSLITARHALDQGREVLVVPGAVDSATSEGSNLLLRDGAGVALDASDVVRLLGWELPGGLTPPAGRAHRTPPHPILDALRQEPATRDELARRLDRSPETLARELLFLELEGRVVEERDGRLHARPATPTGPGSART